MVPFVIGVLFERPNRRQFSGSYGVDSGFRLIDLMAFTVFKGLKG